MWNEFNSYPRNPTSTFRNGDVLELLSESLRLNFNMHPCASYLSICKQWQCQFPQPLQNEKHLSTYIRFCRWLFSLQLNDFKLFTVG